MGIEVYFASGLRKIKPYYNTRSSFAKGRWCNRTLLDVLSDEFVSSTGDEHAQRIETGDFQIIRDGVPLSVEQTFSELIRNKDVIQSTNHKHEPPVLQWCDQEVNSDVKVAGMDIVYEDQNLLVIDKPSGIPIHPTGNFYQNTVVEVLKRNGRNVFPSHRLDKVTSGVLILTKNCHMAKKVQERIRSHDMVKLYFARVQGKFPHVSEVESGLRLEDVFRDESIVTTATSPIYTVEPKKQFPSGFSAAREATTAFYPVKYFPKLDETLVVCKPLTGRTHQIRIHLARLGYPITDDPFYNLKTTRHPIRLKFILDFDNWNDSRLTKEELFSQFQKFVDECEVVRKSKDERQVHSTCSVCGALEMEDPKLEELNLCLHAWKYSDFTGELSFETKVPTWALRE